MSADTLHQRWHAFLDEVQEVARKHWSPDDDPGFVMGLQVRSEGEDAYEVENDGHRHELFIGSNLEMAAIPMALEDMHEKISQQILAAADHAGALVHMDPSEIPEEVRRAAEAQADAMGMPHEDIVYVQPAADPGPVPTDQMPTDEAPE